MEMKRDMKKHITVVSVLQIVFGVLSILLAITVFLLFNFAQSFVQDVEIAEVVLDYMKVIIPFLTGIGGILGIVGGIALLNYRPWARILVIVLSALDCLNIPIGTAKGVYSIWVLLQDETLVLFSGNDQEIEIKQ